MTAKCEGMGENKNVYKLVPPDGGWGYMIALALVIVMVTVSVPMNCFGIIFGDFLETHDISTGKVGLQNGVFFLTFSISAFLTNIGLKHFTMRTVGLFGAALYIAGAFGSIFMNSFLELVFFNALLESSGGGLMMTCIMCVFNLYFEKKRVFIMSICQTLICLLSILAPMLINSSLIEFGFRGTLALLCGAALQNLVAFVLVQPVDRHLIEDGAATADFKLHELEPLNADVKKILKSNVVTQIEADQSKISEEITKHTSKIRMVANYLDLPLLQQPVFLNVCLGTGLVLAVDICFLTLLPLHLTQVKWTADEVAVLMTMVNAGDAVGRVSLSTISGFYNVNSRLTFLLGVIGTTVIKFGMFTLHGVLEVTTACAVMGFFRCFLMVTYPLVIADAVPADKYPAAQGLQTLLCGLISFVTSPVAAFVGTLGKASDLTTAISVTVQKDIDLSGSGNITTTEKIGEKINSKYLRNAGAVKDWSGSYVVSFHLLTSSGLVLCIVPWILEMILKKRNRPAVTQVINDKP